METGYVQCTCRLLTIYILNDYNFSIYNIIYYIKHYIYDRLPVWYSTCASILCIPYSPKTACELEEKEFERLKPYLPELGQAVGALKAYNKGLFAIEPKKK